jgi:predicted DNA-binding protein
MEKKLINARITKSEFSILDAYAKKEGRTKTDVLRELIRSLEKLEEKKDTTK